MLLPFYGLRMELGPIAEWGLNLEKNLITVDPCDLGHQHAGHLWRRRHRDLSRQAEADSLRLLRDRHGRPTTSTISSIPDKPLHFEYSTTRGVPAD